MEEKTKNIVLNEIETIVKYLIEQSNNNKINKGKLSFIETPKDSISQLLNETINNENKDLGIPNKISFEHKQKFNTISENQCHYFTKETSKESIFEKNNVNSNRNKNDDNGKIKEKIIGDFFLECDNNYIKDIRRKHLNYFKKIYDEMLKEWKNVKVFHLFNKKLISYYFITFCLRNEFELFINSWNNKDINKFFINQIYLFISVLYLNENCFLNKTEMRNFLNAFEYSLQNFQMLNLFTENDKINDKDKLTFKTKNKIILSLFQTVNTFKLEYFHDIFKLLDCIKKNESLLKIIKDIEQKSKSIQEYD